MFSRGERKNGFRLGLSMAILIGLASGVLCGLLFGEWIRMQETARTIRTLYDKWSLGQGANQTGSRWCVLRDVLHWAD